MKKRAVLYTIYCCIVIIVLASFLVFKLNKDEDSEPPTRAKSILINTPREITVSTNKQIKLLDGFISVEPANAIELLTYSVSASATTSVENFVFDFENKTFLAKRTGYYYIEFSLPKNAYSNLSDTLKIHAVADTKQDFSLQTNQIFVGKSANFGDIFKQNSVFNYTVELENDNLSFANNCFYANKAGKTKVSITITRGYVQYVNTYEIHIDKDFSQPQEPGEGGDSGTEGGDHGGGSGGTDKETDNPEEKFVIRKNEEYFNEKTNIYTVQFEVLFGNNQYISQKIMATVSDSTIAQVIDFDQPFVHLQILKSGKFTLTLTLLDNPEISLDIEISVVLENEKT